MAERFWMKAATVDELSPGQGKKFESASNRVALFNINGEFYAVDDICPHAGGPLSQATAEGDVLTCSWHGSKFNAKTGAIEGPPAHGPVETYPVRVEGQDVLVLI